MLVLALLLMYAYAQLKGNVLNNAKIIPKAQVTDNMCRAKKYSRNALDQRRYSKFQVSVRHI